MEAVEVIGSERSDINGARQRSMTRTHKVLAALVALVTGNDKGIGKVLALQRRNQRLWCWRQDEIELRWMMSIKNFYLNFFVFPNFLFSGAFLFLVFPYFFFLFFFVSLFTLFFLLLFSCFFFSQIFLFFFFFFKN